MADFQVQQNFDWVKTRIDRWRQCLPVRFRRADELRLGTSCDARQTALFEIGAAQYANKRNKRKVSATDPHQSLCHPARLIVVSAAAPAFGSRFNLTEAGGGRPQLSQWGRRGLPPHSRIW
jgi:hypothetical protein